MNRLPKVAAIRMSGVIRSGSGRDHLSVEGMEKNLHKAFNMPRVRAVILQINSPGGSAGQSEMLYRRIMEYKQSHSLPVYAFVEDAAASGAYMLACAADEIYALESSIVGSIGVVSGGFGYVDLIKKLGITRRLYTAGVNKATLDPFQEENEEDILRLKAIQLSIHDTFKGIVVTARGHKLKVAVDKEIDSLFTGEVWNGKNAIINGLIDGIGTPHSIMKDKVGSCRLVSVVKPSLSDKLSFFRGQSTMSLSAPDIISALEDRFLCSSYGI
jgi:signal peptide peptidase SppA